MLTEKDVYLIAAIILMVMFFAFYHLEDKMHYALPIQISLSSLITMLILAWAN